MNSKGIIPEQGTLYAKALSYARELDLEHLRRLNQVLDTEIIRKKTQQ